MFFCLEMHANEAKGSIQSRIDPFASFACKTADNCDNSYCIVSVVLLQNLKKKNKTKTNKQKKNKKKTKKSFSVNLLALLHKC